MNVDSHRASLCQPRQGQTNRQLSANIEETLHKMEGLLCLYSEAYLSCDVVLSWVATRPMILSRGSYIDVTG